MNQDVQSYIRTLKLDLYGFYVGRGYKCLQTQQYKIPFSQSNMQEAHNFIKIQTIFNCCTSSH